MMAWYRQVSRDQWRAFLATFSAWVIDAFDFTILTFVLINIQQSFSVNAALAGALGTVTLVFRVVGGIGAGTAADRWGRKRSSFRSHGSPLSHFSAASRRRM
jgi:MFS family permease